MIDKRNLVEAALFMATKPITVEEIAQVINHRPNEVKKILNNMGKNYGNHGFELLENNGLYELKVKKDYIGAVSQLAPNQDFSRAILQTLSVISYRNPVKQSEIIKLRGNRGYDHLKELENRGFIRKEPHGHTSMVHITNKFLEYFGFETPEEVKQAFEDKENKVSSDKIIEEENN